MSALNRIAHYCSCGAQITSRETNKGVRQAEVLWLEAHQGDGHSKVTQRQCANARSGIERKRIEEERRERMREA